MDIQDFRFMTGGNCVKGFASEDVPLLAPVDIRGKGNARALLLLHGFSSSPAVFRAMHPAITGYDAVVCPVLPGHADSIATFAKSTSIEWVAAAMDACEDLINNYQTVDVLGLSLGGVLACHLSQQYALNRLYLLAPSLSLRLNVPVALCAARVLQGFGMRRLRNRAGNLYTHRYPELAYRQQPLSAIIEILTLIKNFSLVTPRCPTDLFLGRFDAVVDSQQVAARFKNMPHVTTHWLEHSAHVLPLDGDMEAIVACVNASAHRL